MQIPGKFLKLGILNTGIATYLLVAISGDMDMLTQIIVTTIFPCASQDMGQSVMDIWEISSSQTE